jgi:putative addiction module component (TIGR02574 family)
MENAAVNPRFKEILTLSVRERLRLLHAIVDSLEAETEAIELSAAQESAAARGAARRHPTRPTANRRAGSRLTGGTAPRAAPRTRG